MLRDDFYTTEDIKRDRDSLSCTIRFNGAHAIFGGHFPQQPVVPGVCMMQIVKELLEEQVGRSLLLSAAPQAKFLRLIRPDTEVQAALSWTEDKEGRLQAQVVFRAEEAALFKMSGLFI